MHTQKYKVQIKGWPSNAKFDSIKKARAFIARSEKDVNMLIVGERSTDGENKE